MKSYDIYGIGAALVDIEYSVDDAFLSQNKIDKGVMALVDEVQQHQMISNLSKHSTLVKRSSGGSACNTIVASSGFGSKAFYAGKVGSDDDGQFFIQDLDDHGVDFRQTDSSAGITGKCLVMITDDAERTMNTFLVLTQSFVHKKLILRRWRIHTGCIWRGIWLPTRKELKSPLRQCRTLNVTA